MQDLSRWERSYSVGNWMLDNQHRNLLTLCQQTIEQVNRSAPIQALADELLSCTHEHFHTEENVLRLTAYSDFAQHQAEHRRCLEALTRKLTQACKGKLPAQELCRFLPLWCMGHILEADRKFAAAIQRRPDH